MIFYRDCVCVAEFRKKRSKIKKKMHFDNRIAETKYFVNSKKRNDKDIKSNELRQPVYRLK